LKQPFELNCHHLANDNNPRNALAGFQLKIVLCNAPNRRPWNARNPPPFQFCTDFCGCAEHFHDCRWAPPKFTNW